MYESELDDWIMFERDVMEVSLKEKVMRVTFTKVNGEERVMDCTLMEGVVPETKGGKKPNPEVLNVWDVNKNDWRSFKIANVTSFEAVE